MTDRGVERLAKTLVGYCSEVKPGDVVVLMGDDSGLPLVRETYKNVILAGGHCITLLSDGTKPMSGGVLGADAIMGDFFLRHASDEQMNWISPLERWITEEANVHIQIRSSSNTRRGSSIDPQRIAQRAASRNELSKIRFKRSAAHDLRWVLTMFPTEAHAQEADMSLEEWENFVYGATFADQPDPVVCWNKLEAEQQ